MCVCCVCCVLCVYPIDQQAKGWRETKKLSFHIQVPPSPFSNKKYIFPYPDATVFQTLQNKGTFSMYNKPNNFVSSQNSFACQKKKRSVLK